MGSAWSMGGARAGRDREDLDLFTDMVQGLTLPLLSLPPHLVPPQAAARKEESPETWFCLVQCWCRSPGHMLKTPTTLPAMTVIALMIDSC